MIHHNEEENMKKNIIIEENGKVRGLDSKPKHPIVEFFICIL